MRTSRAGHKKQPVYIFTEKGRAAAEKLQPRAVPTSPPPSVADIFQPLTPLINQLIIEQGLAPWQQADEAMRPFLDAVANPEDALRLFNAYHLIEQTRLLRAILAAVQV
jgi:hypothetical protein